MAINLPHKQIRAQVIKEYMAGTPYNKAVVLSCGNAAYALQDAQVDTLHIGAQGVLEPKQWFTQQEIAQIFPNHFDATSGHLSMDVMLLISKAFKQHLGAIPDTPHVIPTGSGETLVCLKLAYPSHRFIAQYNLNEATEYNKGAPLNDLVALLADDILGVDADANHQNA